MTKFKKPIQRDNGLDAGAVSASMDEIMLVTKAYAKGDFTQRVPITADGKKKEGYFLLWAETANYILDVSSTLVLEISRVAHEIGVEGKLSSRINSPDSEGDWKELIESVNLMASNVEVEVRSIAEAINAVASGDLSHKITVAAQGEFLEIKDIVNANIVFLKTFVSVISRVVREIGTEGKLEGRVTVLGVHGAWQELTNDVNELAGKLAEQLQAIHEIARMVAAGDFTRSISVVGGGEVAELAEKINQMIRDLQEIEVKNWEQNWLNSSLAKTTQAVQIHSDLKTIAEVTLPYVVKFVDAQHGVFYIMKDSAIGEAQLQVLASFDSTGRINIPTERQLGEGPVGQCAIEKKPILLANVPNDYIQVDSSLTKTKPFNVIVVPIMCNDEVCAVIELASVTSFSEIQQSYLEQVTVSLGVVINTALENTNFQELLAKSEAVAKELQSQQHKLQASHQELEERTQSLEDQNLENEMRSWALEISKAKVEERATQLSLSSQYKSDFLSNMSHELRTPLNSLLILAEHLVANSKDHLDAKEVEFAKLIQVSGNDLLSLINNILDLAKIESGVVSVHLTAVPILEIKDLIEKTFRHVAADRGLDFHVNFAKDLPPVVVTDVVRLQQIIKNLLSNAFKFTNEGLVSIRVERALSGWSSDNERLNNADVVLAFIVEDTGIGISTINQEIIFEAFHQEEAGAARRFGGTGLGLSISREIANLLGAELKLVQSTLQVGSTFTLFLPCGKIEDTVDQVKEVALDRDVTRENDKSDLKGVFSGKKVLIVDDDNRNIIALTAVLEDRGAIVFSERSGRDAINLLTQTPDINLVLMDIMMPEMDGYETIREIRTLELFAELPIIALTAKAMVGDREKCLEAGASDYFSKPVNVEKLSAMMQGWLD